MRTALLYYGIPDHSSLFTSDDLRMGHKLRNTNSFETNNESNSNERTTMFLKYAYFLVSITIIVTDAFISPSRKVREGVLSPLRFKDNFADDPTNGVTQDDIEQLSKQRPYGAFVAEKMLEYLEGSSKQSQHKNDMEELVKEKIVVLGTGWASTAFLKNIDTDLYDVTVVSPRNYFLFTPLLAGASVGSLEYRSITEPVREINNKAVYLEGTAVHIDTASKTVIAEPVQCEGNSLNYEGCGIQDHVEISYDRLIFTIGAQTNTFGTPGVEEYCNFLKQVGDARKIRAAIINCFDRASYPELSEEEKTNILTFAIIGAGPSGIEFAAELRDFVEQDGPRYYPNLLKNVRIKVIEGSNTILAPFHKTLQKEAIEKMNSQAEIKDPAVRKLLPPRFKLIEVMLESFVSEVTENTIKLKDGSEVHYGLALWAAGNAPLPLTSDLIQDLGDDQQRYHAVARGRIATDLWLRAFGGKGGIFVLGDASCVVHNELPATGQVAAQEGEFVARLFNKQYDVSHPTNERGTLFPPVFIPNVTQRSLSDSIASMSTKSYNFAKPFQYLNIGIRAFTGRDTALAHVATAPNLEPITVTGKIGSELWKSVYLWKQVSWRNRLMVLADWSKRQLFGRDITHLE